MNTIKKYKILIALLFIISVLFIGCEDKSDLTAPQPPATGSADFSSFVAIGNSLTAGFQNNSLYESSQMYSFGNLIAQQVQTSFAQPIISDPGIPGRLELKALVPSPKIEANPSLGSAMNTTYAKPYNNLGIPGAILFDLTDTTDFAQKSLARANPYFQLVLRNAQFGKSVIEQAVALNPKFVTLWIGNNDVLGYATSGGTRGSDATGKLPTDANVFAFLYNQVAQALAATGAKVVMANIPDVKAIPFFTTVGPQVAQGIQNAQQQNPQIVGLYYQKNGQVIANPQTDFATPAQLANLDLLITLTSSSYASLLGDTNGKYYTDNGITPPAGIDTNQPFGFHPQNPWPDAFILDADEQTVAANAITSFNNTISGVVASNPNFALVDINTVFKGFIQGKMVDGLGFSTAFVLGRLFSLDGVHPTTQGYGIVANEFIKVINSKFGANIPQVNISTLPGSVPVTKMNTGILGLPIFEGIENLKFYF